MLSKAKSMLRMPLRAIGYDIIRSNDPVPYFHSDLYLRHNERRLEHLASLRIPVADMTVLEVGGGIGDQSHYYLDRGCQITITEVRTDNLKRLKHRYPQHNVLYLNMERPVAIAGSPFDLVHCYGLLYHLSNPEPALEFLSSNCTGMLFLETCVSFGDTKEINRVHEDRMTPSQAYSGIGCRPTRPWIWEKLKELFEFAYVPKTQPNNAEFPLDWTNPEKHRANLSRAVFIASRHEIDNDQLCASLILHHTRHE